MKTSKAIVVVVTISVALVFVAPLVNLEPTALRSAKSALALFAALTSLALANLVESHQLLDQPLTQCLDVVRSLEGLLDLTCSRLC